MTRDHESPHPVERSTYHPILNYLENIGFSGIQEIKRENDFADIFFEVGNSRFIAEIKIRKKSGLDQMNQGIVQAYRYGLNYQTMNIMVIVLPSLVSEDLHNSEEFRDRVMKSRVEAVILTKYWHSYETKLSVEDLLGNLKAKIEQSLNAVASERTASTMIQKSVKNLSRLLNRSYWDEGSIQRLSDELTKDYGLFVALSSPSGDLGKLYNNRRRNQTIDLVAYILVNQILFYFLYSSRSQQINTAIKVPEMRPIKHLNDLTSYFEKISEIDFQPVFDIQVTHRIPFSFEIIKEINALIGCLTPLQVAELKHDLYGKLFENSLPKETRKVLASYYTKSSSADLLTYLTIDNYSDTIWDLACGSGTLLMSSYDRKMELYKNERRMIEEEYKKQLHTRFVEKELTGTDIMPFACHLTGINLSAKRLDIATTFMRISCTNVLNIEPEANEFTFMEAYGEIIRETKNVYRPQTTVDDYRQKITTEIKEPKPFTQEKVDRIVINPPFTGVKRFPKSYLKEFNEFSLNYVSGNRNLWGHFMALSDKVLKQGGKIGAIVPISLMHGKDTLKLRRHYLENYSIQYIIKPIVGKSFSEDSRFTDIIFIAAKVKPEKNHEVRFVCLKEDISQLSRVDVDALAKNIKTELSDSDDVYLSYSIRQEELLDNADNLMKFLFTNQGGFRKEVSELTARLHENNNFVLIDRKRVSDGLALRIKDGVRSNVFTRKLTESRVSKAQLQFDSDNDQREHLYYSDGGSETLERIDKSALVPTLRTLTGISKIDVTPCHDYIRRDEYRHANECHLFIQNRFRMSSDDLHFVSVYSEVPIRPLNLFMMYNTTFEDSKILSLYFNSIYFLLQLLSSSKQSTEGYLEIKQLDMGQLIIPNLTLVETAKRQKLLAFFENVRYMEVENIYNQLAGHSEFRLSLDKTIADSFGIKLSEKKLANIYRLTVKHIDSMERL